MKHKKHLVTRKSKNSIFVFTECGQILILTEQELRKRGTNRKDRVTCKACLNAMEKKY